MSLSHGANIVRNGLVLHLDAANPKSYPGTGTAWKDLSGYGNDAALYNTPTYNSVDRALSFNGIDSYGIIDANLKTIINNALEFTLITFSNIKFIEHVDNLVGWGNANGASTTFGQYANSATLRTSFGGSTLGDLSNLGNKWLSLVSRYDATNIYSDVLGDYTYSSTVASTNWKPIDIMYPITIAKTSYYSRYMQTDIATILMYDRMLSNSEVTQIYNNNIGRYNNG